MNYLLQIGEGNFLRAFAEDFVQEIYNQDKSYKVIITQPRTNTKVIDMLNSQNNEYDIIFKGRLGGETVNKRKHINCIESAVDSVSEFDTLKNFFKSSDLKIVMSNTTEAGITFVESDKKEDYPNISFPAKVTVLLFERYKNCGEPIVFIPCELIEANGDKLKECILRYAELWKLESGFKDYVNDTCHFCNSLVDRIVTGHDEKDGDKCSVTCEPYRSLIIDCDEFSKSVIPFKGVEYTNDLSFYRRRKVKILNGIHTMTFAASFLSGVEIVRDAVNDELLSAYILKGSKEIEKTLNSDISDYTKTVIERFNNPYIDHKFLDISLNSISKFKERCLPSLIEYVEITNELPSVLSFSFAAIIAFYKKDVRSDYEVRDGKDVLDFFSDERSVSETLSNKEFWDRDLTKINGLCKRVENYYNSICKNGMINAVKEVVYE